MRGDDLLVTIKAIHAAGLDESLWPQALAATARTVGGNAATLEVFGKQSLRPTQMYSFGVPRHEEIAYLARLAETNIRLPFVAEQPLDDMLWDFKIVDEGAMRRSPFYAEFLARMDMRYFVSGIVHKTNLPRSACIARRRWATSSARASLRCVRWCRMCGRPLTWRGGSGGRATRATSSSARSTGSSCRTAAPAPTPPPPR